MSEVTIVPSEIDQVKEATKTGLQLAYDQIDELTEKYNSLLALVTTQASLIDNILNVEIPRIDARIAGMIATQISRLR